MKKVHWFPLAVMFAIFAFSPALIAGDEPEGEDEGDWVVGTVVVKKDAKGKVESAVIETTDINDEGEEVKVSYKVTMDKKGGKLAAEMAGKKVDATVKFVNKGTEDKPDMWIVVKSYTEVKEDEAAVE